MSDTPPKPLKKAPHPLATRQKAIRLIEKGERKAEVCRILNVDPKTLRRWWDDHLAGRTPGVAKQPLIPVDEAPNALAIPEIAQGGSLAEILAANIPVGTPVDVWRNAMMQKIAAALQNSPIPVPKSVKEWKELIALGNDLMGAKPGAGRKAGAGGTALTIRFEALGKAPRVAGMGDVVVDAEVSDVDEEVDDGTD